MVFDKEVSLLQTLNQHYLMQYKSRSRAAFTLFNSMIQMLNGGSDERLQKLTEMIIKRQSLPTFNPQILQDCVSREKG